MNPDKQLPQIPLPSIDDLVMLVYKQSGYKMQISGEDPLLSVVYLNQAVLGATLLFAKEKFAEENRTHLERIERNYQRVIAELMSSRRQNDGYREQPLTHSEKLRESPEQRAHRTAREGAQQRQRIADATLTAETTASLLKPITTAMMDSLVELGRWEQHADNRVTQLAKKLYLVVGVSIFASTCLGVLIGKLL